MPITNVLLIGEKELNYLLAISDKYKESLRALDRMANIIQYDDKDEDEKLIAIQNELNNLLSKIKDGTIQKTD
jgi:hypothetical protein